MDRQVAVCPECAAAGLHLSWCSRFQSMVQVPPAVAKRAARIGWRPLMWKGLNDSLAGVLL